MTSTVSFQQDTCRVTLYLPKIHELPLSNIRKLFSMMLSEPWNNERAITDTSPYLEAAVEDSKAAWGEASKNYQRGWRLIEKPLRRQTKQEVHAAAEIRANNEALIRAVKRTKAQHERWVKVLALWNDTKHKLN